MRRRDAHAWTEFYDRQSKQWTRIDPTPLAAMDKIMGIEKISRFSKFKDLLHIKIVELVEFFRKFNYSGRIKSIKLANKESGINI